jgi:hypothetical protein
MHILTKGTIAVALTIALLYFTTANAQSLGNATAKLNMTVLNVLSNTTAKLNMTSSKPGNTTAKANMTASKAVANATTGMNKTGSELGKNASQAGKQILNKTEEIGKKIAGGLGSLLGNASEKLKQSSK